MRALITGAAGFAGSHLTELLLQEGIEPHATYYCETELEDLPDAVKEAGFVQCDILDREQLGRIVSDAAPDVVFHLAAIASVSESERNPNLAIETNIAGSANLLDTVKENAPEARVIIISSSEVYGQVTRDQVPLREDAPVAPCNLYGVTKASVELLSKLYVARNGLDSVILRPFNHIGPRQNPAFVCADFASQIAKIERGLMPPQIAVGDISVERDFTDVRDMVKGYLAAARRAQRGETYNLCSGRTCRIEKLLNTLLGFAEIPIEVRPDPAKQRTAEIPVLLGTAEKFNQATGWSPEIPFQTTLKDTLNYWRAKVRVDSPPEGADT